MERHGREGARETITFTFAKRAKALLLFLRLRFYFLPLHRSFASLPFAAAVAGGPSFAISAALDEESVSHKL